MAILTAFLDKFLHFSGSPRGFFYNLSAGSLQCIQDRICSRSWHLFRKDFRFFDDFYKDRSKFQDFQNDFPSYKVIHQLFHDFMAILTAFFGKISSFFRIAARISAVFINKLSAGSLQCFRIEFSWRSWQLSKRIFGLFEDFSSNPSRFQDFLQES